MIVFDCKDFQNGHLNGVQVGASLEGREIAFNPPLDKWQLRHSGAVDLRIGQTIQVAKPFDPNNPNPESLFEIKELEKGKPFLIAPKETVWLQTSQRIKLPAWVIGWVRGRTSFMRKGLISAHTGPVDPCYVGKLTIPMTNHTNYPQPIRAGERFCSLYLERIVAICESEKEAKALSKYHNQDPVVGCLPEKDPDEEDAIVNGTYHSKDFAAFLAGYKNF